MGPRGEVRQREGDDPVDGRLERRQVDRVRGPRRRLPRLDGGERGDAQPDARAEEPRTLPALLARREEGARSSRTGRASTSSTSPDVAGEKPWDALTTDLDRTAYHAEWSPDGTKLLFGDKDLRLFVVDVATKKRTKIAESRQLANDEFSWEISRLRLVPGRRLGRVHADRAEPQRADPAPRARDREDGRGDRRLLPLRQPVLRPEGRAPLLPLLPELHDPHRRLRGQPRDPDAGDARRRPAPRRAEASVREGSEGRGEARGAGTGGLEACGEGRGDEGRQGAEGAALERPPEGDRRRRGPLLAALPAPREGRDLLPPEGR